MSGHHWHRIPFASSKTRAREHSLCPRRTAHLKRTRTWGTVTAIGSYEDQMRDYGYAAVSASAKAETERGTLRNPVVRWLYRRSTQ
jgi:hypothetical protein